MDMPLEQIKAVLSARDPDERVRSMERRLEQTQATVASLRALLEGSDGPLEVERRRLVATPALLATSRVE
jgi:hypothetical protein